MPEITGEVSGVSTVCSTTSRWHSDVTAWAIVDGASGEDIADRLHGSVPPRGHLHAAAAFPLVAGRREADGGYRHPVSAIVANLTKPTPERPSLLQHDEGGDAVPRVRPHPSPDPDPGRVDPVLGSSTENDFVEAPSQTAGHWCWKPEVLQRFARHHETGEPIPPTWWAGSWRPATWTSVC